MTIQPEALRLADRLEANAQGIDLGAEAMGWFISTSRLKEAAAELRRLHEVTQRQAHEIDAFEKFRPHWAMGYTSDSAAAQASTAALSNLWEMLDVSNQTEAVIKLRRLHEVNAKLVEACTHLVQGIEACGITGIYLDLARAAIAEAIGEQQ